MTGLPIVVFSDIHGDSQALSCVLQASRDFKASMLLFVGDWDEKTPQMDILLQNRTCPLLEVRGNCDWGAAAPLYRVLDLNNWHILMYHGHRIPENLEDYPLVITGHTHCSNLLKKNQTIYLNPGSASRPRDSKEPTFALVYQDEILILRLRDCAIIKRCQR